MDNFLHPTRDLIIDGKILANNLHYINLSEQWQIKGYGIENFSDVFYAGLDTAGKLYISKRQHVHEYAGEHGIE
ncbi:MAG: hypothetical protein NUK65_11045 [Firmicutes bacterium]|nr:hypothetical protein [Bacillota bacterium]